MTRPRFALCAIVLGLMGFGTPAAQAEVGAQWLLAEKAPETGLISFLSAQLGLETDVSFVLHTKIAKFTVLFECPTITAVNARLLANGAVGEKEGTAKNSKVRLSGCITKLDGATSKPCEPSTGGKEPGVISTTPLHGLIVLHNNKTEELIQVLPDSGEILGVIEMSEFCAIGEEVPLIGKLFLKDCQNAFLTHLVKHLTEVGPLSELWAISKTEEHTATILGSWWSFLAGSHVGFKFSGDPA